MLAEILLLILSPLIVAGLALLVTMIGCWRKVEPIYSASYSKIVIAVIRCAAAYAAIFVKTNPTDARLFLAQMAGCICFAIWEIIGVLGDSKAKKDEGTFSEMRRQALWRTRLLAVVRGLVNVKANNIRKAIKNGSTRGIGSVRKVLNPDQHSSIILEQLALFLHSQLPASEVTAHQNFRVGLYIPEGGVMTPCVSFDFKTKMTQPFRALGAALGRNQKWKANKRRRCSLR